MSEVEAGQQPLIGDIDRTVIVGAGADGGEKRGREGIFHVREEGRDGGERGRRERSCASVTYKELEITRLH